MDESRLVELVRTWEGSYFDLARFVASEQRRDDRALAVEALRKYRQGENAIEAVEAALPDLEGDRG